jgi:hypothetical protein
MVYRYDGVYFTHFSRENALLSCKDTALSLSLSQYRIPETKLRNIFEEPHNQLKGKR